MHDLQCKMQMRCIVNISRACSGVKGTPEGVEDMCREMDEIYQEGIEVGEKRGERRVKRSIDETQTMEITLEKRIPTTRYRPDHQTGLTAQQVQEHRMHGWTNQPVDPPSKTTKEIIQENVFTYLT